MTTDKKIISGLLLLASFAAANAQTGLLLSGDTIGIFRPVSGASAAVISSQDGWGSSYRIGAPLSGSFQSGAQFNRQDFAGIGDGDTFSAGLITYFNGLNRIGTSSGSALLDIFLRLNGSPDLVRLTTVNLGIEATPNSHGQPVPDIFRASFVQPDPLWVDNQWVKFTVGGLPDSFQLAENSKIDLGHLTVAVIPEPPASAILLGVAILSCLMACRRRGLNAA